MSAKSLKSIFGDLLVAINNFLAKSKKKQLDRQTFHKEAEEFVKSININADILSADFDKLELDFIQYLKDKNYMCADIDLLLGEDIFGGIQKGQPEFKMPQNIQKISEELNRCANGLETFSDKFKIAPGIICYTIDKIDPTIKKPYVTYKPVPCVVTQIHENGANGGTVFFTCSHKFVKSVDFNGNGSYTVVSEEKAFFTPLTKKHAIYVCKILNSQSRIFYMQQIRKQQKTK